MDDFYIKDRCDHCGGSLAGGRIISMYNNECICMKCKNEETLRPDYTEAYERDIKQYKERFKFTFCICGRESTGFGNNPVPIVDNGKCCDECNIKVVIPSRIVIKTVLKVVAEKIKK